ncbi:MAG: Gfo/Idh/MocA family oxidoreductase [Steroidobacteraceae bacterium]
MIHNLPKPIAGRLIRIAVVGCGRIAANHFNAIEQYRDDLQLVGVCDTDPKALAVAQARTGVEGYPSLQDLLQRSDADVVVLCSPSGLHSQQAVLAARAAARGDGKADGHALERRSAHGARMRSSRRASAGGETEPA